MLGGADNSNGELPSYIIGANKIQWIDCCLDPGHGFIVDGTKLRYTR